MRLAGRLSGAPPSWTGGVVRLCCSSIHAYVHTYIHTCMHAYMRTYVQVRLCCSSMVPTLGSPRPRSSRHRAPAYHAYHPYHPYHEYHACHAYHAYRAYHARMWASSTLDLPSCVAWVRVWVWVRVRIKAPRSACDRESDRREPSVVSPNLNPNPNPNPNGVEPNPNSNPRPPS